MVSQFKLIATGGSKCNLTVVDQGGKDNGQKRDGVTIDPVRVVVNRGGKLGMVFAMLNGFVNVGRDYPIHELVGCHCHVRRMLKRMKWIDLIHVC